GADPLRPRVREARVPDEAVDRAVALLRPRAEPRELAPPRLHHLRDAVEHLAAVVGGHAGPLREGAAGRAHRVAQVLPRAARDVLALGLVRAAGLRARERAADEQLVGLLDRQPAHSAAPA